MFKRITKFFRVLGKGFGLSMSSEMAYKFSFILLSISLIFGDLVGPIISYVMYKVSSGLPGWTLMEFILLQGVSIFIFGIWHTFLGGMSWETSDLVDEGEFDSVLIKPFSIIGTLMSRGMDFHGIMDILTGAFLIILAIVKLHLITLNLIPFVFLILLACAFMFSITLILSALAVIFVRIWAFGTLVDLIGLVSSYPLNVYSNTFRFMITFIIPAAIASYWPSAVLLGKEPLSNILMIVIPVLIFWVVSFWFWKYALKRYQSAGG